jgi:hypothetical protein
MMSCSDSPGVISGSGVSSRGAARNADGDSGAGDEVGVGNGGRVEGGCDEVGGVAVRAAEDGGVEGHVVAAGGDVGAAGADVGAVPRIGAVIVVGTGAGIADGASRLTTVASAPGSVPGSTESGEPNAGSAGVTDGTGGGNVVPDDLRGSGGGIVVPLLRFGDGGGTVVPLRRSAVPAIGEAGDRPGSGEPPGAAGDRPEPKLPGAAGDRPGSGCPLLPGGVPGVGGGIDVPLLRGPTGGAFVAPVARGTGGVMPVGGAPAREPARRGGSGGNRRLHDAHTVLSSAFSALQNGQDRISALARSGCRARRAAPRRARGALVAPRSRSVHRRSS